MERLLTFQKAINFSKLHMDTSQIFTEAVYCDQLKGDSIFI